MLTSWSSNVDGSVETNDQVTCPPLLPDRVQLRSRVMGGEGAHVQTVSLSGSETWRAAATEKRVRKTSASMVAMR